MDSFCFKTQYICRYSHTRTHARTLMNTCTQPTPISIFKRLSRQIFEINKVILGVSLSMGTPRTTERIAPIKF